MRISLLRSSYSTIYDYDDRLCPAKVPPSMPLFQDTNTWQNGSMIHELFAKFRNIFLLILGIMFNECFFLLK